MSSGQDHRIEWPDLLRGVSSLAVVLFHVRVTMWIGLRELIANRRYPSIDRTMAWITAPFPFFGMAVMLFFIVSGFAIHYPYAGSGRPFALRPYATRRFFRIYPPYLAAVVIAVLAERAAAFTGAQPSTWAKVGASALMVQNYLHPIGQMSGNPSLWSLPVEVELYLVYPLLLWFWRRAGTSTMLTCVALTSAGASAMLVAGFDWPMGNFAKYWIIWVSGAVLAERLRSGTLPPWRPLYAYLAGGGVVLAVATGAAGLSVGIAHFIWSAVFFLVMLWGLNRPKAVTTLPAPVRRSALFLGDISYSLYLVHFPVLLILGSCWVRAFGHKPVNVTIPLVAALVPIPFAYVLWRLIERPSQAWGRALSQTMVPAIAGSAIGRPE